MLETWELSHRALPIPEVAAANYEASLACRALPLVLDIKFTVMMPLTPNI